MVYSPSVSTNGSSPSEKIPPVPAVKDNTANPPRRSSLGFLRRSKSGDPVRKMPIVAPSAPKLPDLWNGAATPVQRDGPNGGASSSKLGFGKDIRDSVDILSGNFAGLHSAMSKTGTGVQAGGYVPGRKSTDSAAAGGGYYLKTSSATLNEDPYAHSKDLASMANRGRYSYASTAGVSSINSPRRLRRRRDPTPFNVLVIGARNSGKSSFLRFLRQSLAIKPKRGQAVPAEENPNLSAVTSVTTSPFTSSYLETEIEGERIGLTVWDSTGLEKGVVDLQIREIVAFLESKFEETFNEETKVVRAPGVRDTHIHCVFLLLDPARLTPNNHYAGKGGDASEKGGLDADLDISVLKALQGKTLVVPVVSKADTCTERHMEELKKIVRQGLANAGIDPLEALELDLDTPSEPGSVENRGSLAEVDERLDGELIVDSEEEGFVETKKSVKSDASTNSSGKNTSKSSSLGFLPLSIISPDSYEPGEPVGRKFPWGFADPFDEKHCDFVKIREAVFSEWRGDLREKSREVWYESWRTERLGARNRNGR
ncbi:hypothetical protein RUND412_001653 [Rhizina undulata]